MPSRSKHFYDTNLTHKPDRDLNEQEIEMVRKTLLEILHRYPPGVVLQSLNRKALCDLGFGATSAWGFLHRLTKQGYIEKHGTNVNTHYTLTEKGSAKLKIGLRTFWRKEK